MASDFSSKAFPYIQGVVISIDGKGCWENNVFIERILRGVNFYEGYLKAHESPQEAQRQWEYNARFHSIRRRHQLPNRSTLDTAYFNTSHKPRVA